MGARLSYMCTRNKNQSLITKPLLIYLLAMVIKSFATDYGIQNRKRLLETWMLSFMIMSPSRFWKEREVFMLVFSVMIWPRQLMTHNFYRIFHAWNLPNLGLIRYFAFYIGYSILFVWNLYYCLLLWNFRQKHSILIDFEAFWSLKSFHTKR